MVRNNKSNALRVLMLVRLYHPWVGGTERQAQKLSQALINQGVDVKVVTGWWFFRTPRKEIIESVPIYRNFTMWDMFGIRGLRKFGGYLYLISLFIYLWWHRHEYNLIHVHLLNYHAFAAVLAGKLLKKKTIIKIANSGSYSDLIKMQKNELPGTSWMLPITLRADRYIAISRLIVDELQAAGVLSEKIVKIPNGVEVGAFVPKSDYRLHDPVTLIYVGRLYHQKRIEVLLPAFQQAAAMSPELHWRLLLVGDGTSQSSLEKLAQELGGTGEIYFCGEVSDVYSYLAQADLFVLPSKAEGMSNALLEAMACGLPCIASHIGGNSDLIIDGQNGRLVDCNETNKLAQAIVELVENDRLRQRLGLAARQTIEEIFAMEHVSNQYLELYRELIQEPFLKKKEAKPASRLF